MIYVTRKELAKMMGITPTRADVLLCPTAPKSELTREIIELSEKHGGLPHIKDKAGKRGRRALLYPVGAFFPLCRWVDIKTLSDTRPDVVGEYMKWVMREYGIPAEEVKEFVTKWDFFLSCSVPVEEIEVIFVKDGAE